MMIVWLQRLLGFGKLPSQQRPILEAEGIHLMDEGFLIIVTYRAPSRYSSEREKRTIGSFALTEQRLVAYSFSKRIINVPLTDDRLSKQNLSVENDNCFQLNFDAATFRANWSGSVEIQLYTTRARELMDWVQ